MRRRLEDLSTDQEKRLSQGQAFSFGREFHILLELFKYIAEKPDGSRMTLEKLKAASQRKKFVLDVMY